MVYTSLVVRAFSVFVALLLSLCSVRARAEQSYDELVGEAIVARDQGDLVRAHALFEAAHQLDGNARTLRGMAITSFQAGRYLRALHEIDAALRHPNKPLDATLRSSMAELRTRAEQQLAWLELTIEPAEAVPSALYVDELERERATSLRYQLDPGEHTVRVAALGFVEASVRVQLAPGSDQRLAITLARESVAAPAVLPAPVLPTPARPPAATSPPAIPRNPRRLRTSIALLSLGALTGATAGALYLTGRARLSGIVDACRDQPSGGCLQTERAARIEDAHFPRLERAIRGLAGAGAIVGVTGIALLTRDLRERRRAVRVSLLPHGFSVDARF